MSLTEYILLAASSLFVIVDPIAVVPTFLAITPTNTAGERVRMARTASIVAGLVLIGVAGLGQWIFGILGITMPAFRVAGGIILFLVAIDMLRARRTEIKESSADTQAGAMKDDIAITPLAVPMLAGPGACSTVLLLKTKAQSLLQIGMLYMCIVLVCISTFFVLWLAASQAKRLNPLAMRVTVRLMGLLLAAIAAQFVLDGVKESLQL